MLTQNTKPHAKSLFRIGGAVLTLLVAGVLWMLLDTDMVRGSAKAQELADAEKATRDLSLVTAAADDYDRARH